MNYFKEYSDMKKSEEYLYELLENFETEQETIMEILELLELIQDIKKDILSIIVINNK